jgi:hypothetical protein
MNFSYGKGGDKMREKGKAMPQGSVQGTASIEITVIVP